MTTKKLISLVSLQLGIPEDKIQLTDHLTNDLNADSLDLVELLMNIERTFQVAIETDEYENAMTLQQIVNLVEKKLQ